MNRKFLTDISFLIFLNFLIKPFWIFGIDRTVQNTVGTEDYGIYFALFNFSYLFHIVLDFGINNYNKRSVAQDSEFIKNYLPNILFLKMGLSILYFLVTVGCAFLLSFSGFHLKLLGFLALNQIILSLVLFLRSNLSGLHLFKLDSLLSILDRVLMILICSFLLWSQFTRAQFIIEWFVYAQTGSLLITVLAAAGIVMHKAGKLSIKWDLLQVKEIMKSTYPFALLGLLMSIYYRIDGVMIERMLSEDGDYQAGVYAASFRLLDAANMIGYLLASILLPMFARMIKEKKDLIPLLLFSYRSLMVWAVITISVSFIFRFEIMELLYDHSDDYWGQIYGLLFSSYAGICTVYIFGSLLTANGSLRSLNIIAVSGVMLNVILNYMLIPESKAWGASIATVITQSLVAVAHLILAIKYFSIHINLRKLFVFSIFILATIFICVTLYNLDLNWMISLTLSVLMGFVVSVFLGIINVKRGFQLLRQERI